MPRGGHVSHRAECLQAAKKLQSDNSARPFWNPTAIPRTCGCAEYRRYSRGGFAQHAVLRTMSWEAERVLRSVIQGGLASWKVSHSEERFFSSLCEIRPMREPDTRLWTCFAKYPVLDAQVSICVDQWARRGSWRFYLSPSMRPALAKRKAAATSRRHDRRSCGRLAEILPFGPGRSTPE